MAVTAFERTPQARSWDTVQEMVKGKLSDDLLEIAKRALAFEDLRLNTPWRVEQQWHDPLEPLSSSRDVQCLMPVEAVALNTKSWQYMQSFTSIASMLNFRQQELEHALSLSAKN